MIIYLTLVVILLPILGGAIIPFTKFKKKRTMYYFIEALVTINSVLVFFLLFSRPTDSLTVMQFTGDLSISFKVDGLSMVFSGLVAFLWPFATMYAFEYMQQEKHKKIFFMFYTMTYGVTLGIALANNIITLYFFYELLTLVTVSLVMHTLTKEAIAKSRTYLYYSLGGAAFAFIGVIFIVIYGEGNFQFGGVMSSAQTAGVNDNLLLLIYVFSFLGFGVKAAICPFNSWLPEAGVAPTPVTALLHAVAVVKSGAFATMRLTFYCFNFEIVKGTWAQDILLLLVIFTIVYGCSRAVKETHLKRRLAYSTISNLSYILFGVLIMTPLGLLGALAHMVVHAFVKISAFFCAGSIIHKTEKNYIHQMNGLGRKMPITFTIFTISGLALMGLPGLSGFISKWYLAEAAVQSLNPLAYVGIGAILISALLTAIYMINITVRAFCYKPEPDMVNATDPNWLMILPLVIFTIIIIAMGLHSQPFIDFLKTVVGITTQGGL